MDFGTAQPVIQPVFDLAPDGQKSLLAIAAEPLLILIAAAPEAQAFQSKTDPTPRF